LSRAIIRPGNEVGASRDVGASRFGDRVIPARVSSLHVAQYAPVGINGLLHHAVSGQHACQRRSPVAPGPPDAHRPVQRLGTRYRAGVEREGGQQLRIARRRGTRDRVDLGARGQLRQGIGLVAAGGLLVPAPGFRRIWAPQVTSAVFGSDATLVERTQLEAGDRNSFAPGLLEQRHGAIWV